MIPQRNQPHGQELGLRARDFQFSIKRLLIATAVCAALLGVGRSLDFDLPLGAVLTMVVFLILFNDWSAIYVYHGYGQMRHGNYGQAVVDFSRAIKADPEKPERYCYRAMAYCGQQDYAAAVQDYTAAIRVQSRYAPAWVGRASVQLWLKNYQQAFDDATVALCLTPGDVETLMIRGAASMWIGDLDAAIEDLNDAVLVAPNDGRLYRLRGLIHAYAENYERAIDDFRIRQCQEECRDDNMVVVGLAIARFRLGQYQAARTSIDEHLRDNPRSVEALCVSAWMLATCPDDQHRNGAQALELAEKAQEQAAGQPGSCLSSLAAAYAELGMFDRATEHGRRALELALPFQRAEWQRRLAAYEAHRPYRDFGKQSLQQPPSGSAES